MSDPVSNVEMEDVLSSIRRLVSEDSRPKFDRQALEKNDEISEDLDGGAGFETPQALVLTPALRVAEVGDEPLDETSESAPEPAEELAESAAEAPEETTMEVAEESWESAGATNSEAEPEAADETEGASENTESDAQDAAEGQDFSDSAQAMSDEDSFSDEELSGDESGEFGHLSFETRISEVEDAVSDQDEQWEPDGEGQGDNAAEPVEALTWEDHLEDSADDPAEDQADQVVENPQWGNEDAHQGDFGASAPEQPDVDEGSLAEDEDPQNDPEIDLFGADDVIVDEDMLREMVSEIVRQELQGALGERITRNVRKLVRREIHRALASQDLE